jgi:DNA polymerase-3 subunit beta
VEITVDRDLLADAVCWTARALPARPVSPVLACMRLDAGSGLTLSAFDYEVSARATLPVTDAGEGTALVSGRLLAEIVRSLPTRPAELATDGARMTLRCGTAMFTLLLLPDGDYPSLPDMPPLAGTAGSDTFAAAAGQVAVAAGKDGTLPALTGVRIEIDGDRLTLVATDRYRLAIRELRWNPVQPGMATTILVPARVLLDATRAATTAAEVSISLATPETGGSDGLAGFEAAGRRTTVRLLGGEFPRYRALVPSEFSGVAEVPVEPFAEAVKRVALVAERNTPIRLTFRDGGIQLEAGTGDEAQATESLEAGFTGEDGFQIAFNPHYLLDGLGAISSDMARIAVTDPAKPAVITGKAEGDPEYRYLLMPIRLAG